MIQSKEVITMENNYLCYKGRPLVRSGNEMYFGNMSDKYIILIKELATKTPGGNYGLFTGPGANYLRADKGGAHIRPTEKCSVIGMEGRAVQLLDLFSFGMASDPVKEGRDIPAV